MRLEPNEIKIEPMKTKTVDLITKIQEVVKKSNISEKEIQESGRRIRKKLAQQFLE